MPFKSQAQRRKFAQLLVEGKISGDTYEEWNRETGAKRLPERSTKPKGRTTKRTKGRTTKGTKKKAGRADKAGGAGRLKRKRTTRAKRKGTK